MVSLPPDIRRAVWRLLALAGACVVLTALYTNPYLFVDPFGRGLPDISPTSSQLALSFQVGAGLCMLWANVLVLLATPAPAAALRRFWHRAVQADERRRWTWAAAAGLGVAYAVGRMGLNEETVHATLAMLTDGDALLPFQYRTLVPWIGQAVQTLAPSLPLPVLYGGIEAVAGVAAWAAVSALLRALGEAMAASRVAALAVFVPLAFNLVAPWRYNAIFFPYDTPSVAFVAWSLALLIRERYVAYAAVLAVATLNRETTCFVVVAACALGIGRMPWLRLLAFGAVQTLLWIGIKTGLGALYAGNEALGDVGLFASMIDRSGRILTAVPGWVYLALIPLGGLATVVWLLRSRVADPRIGRMAWMVPPFLLGMVVVGELMEVRIYSELIPLVVVALVAVVRSVVREAAVPRPEPMVRSEPVPV